MEFCCFLFSCTRISPALLPFTARGPSYGLEFLEASLGINVDSIFRILALQQARRQYLLRRCPSGLCYGRQELDAFPKASHYVLY